MSKPKKNISAADCSGKAFMTNPIVSVNDHTGMTPRIPNDFDEADEYAEMFDVPVTARDGDRAVNEDK